MRGDPTGGGGEGRPGKTVLFTGPDTQSRNAFKRSKERAKERKKRGKRGGREGGREKGEEEE